MVFDIILQCFVTSLFYKRVLKHGMQLHVSGVVNLLPAIVALYYKTSCKISHTIGIRKLQLHSVINPL